MMLSQALMRHCIGEDLNLERVVNDHQKSNHYRKILRSLIDNDETVTGAFSIQNVAKMGLCHNKFPGEWYGPHAIAVMLKVTKT